METKFNAAATENHGNALSTNDQRQVVMRALKIIQTPEVRAGRARAALLWKGVLQDDPPAAAWASFEAMMDEYVFNYVLKATNSDANYPKVLHVYTPPYELGGQTVPGSRWGGDNCDNVYRIIPVDGKARFRLDGRQSGSGPANVSFTLVANWETSKTVSGIENHELLIGSDGRFAITIDPEPANGRPNHLQSKPGTLLIFIRDTLTDWRQPANALSIQRLDPPTAPPLSDQQIAEFAAEIMVDGVPLVYWFFKFIVGRPPNKVEFIRSGTVGGLVTQRAAPSHVVLEDDEALVVNIDDANAAYSAVQSHDYWFKTTEYAAHTVSLNKAQVVPDMNGAITYVVSARDPGVHNWIDTRGVRNFPLMVRVQGLPAGNAAEPVISGVIVKLSELQKALPAETKWVGPEERKAQTSRRLAEFNIRMRAR